MEKSKEDEKIPYVDLETYYEGRELRAYAADYGMKRCKHCKEVKYYTDFPKAPANGGFQYGVRTVCFECLELIKQEKAERRAKERAKMIQKRIDEPTKKCTSCGKICDKSEFIACKKALDGLNSHCSSCRAAKRKDQYNNLTPEQRQKRYEKILQGHKDRIQTDWQYRFISIMRQKIRYAVKSAKTPRLELEEVLGCSVAELRAYLGEYDSQKHHIDHIIPLSRFNYEDPRVHKVAFNYRNTRIIENTANVKKSNLLVSNWRELLEDICNTVGEDVNFILENLNTGRPKRRRRGSVKK